MKLLLKIALLLLLPAFVKSQTRQQIDSAYLILQHAANDTVRMGACSMLGSLYEDINQELLVELRKIRTISRRMCYLIVVFIIVTRG